MSGAMLTACHAGDVVDITSLRDAGENVNSVHTGCTPIAITLLFDHAAATQALFARGADLSIVDDEGLTTLHQAAAGGYLDCIKLVLDHSTIDINVINDDGNPPIAWALRYNKFEACKLLVEKGANIFMKDNDDVRAIDLHVDDDPNDDALGPRVIQHFLDIRWESVKLLLLVANSIISSDAELINSSSSSSSSSSSKAPNLPQRRSSRLAAPIHTAYLMSKVFSNSGLVRHISSFFIETGLILVDPDVVNESDEVKLRVEATLAAAAGESNKRARTE
jgi:ankyrin repeat protein